MVTTAPVILTATDEITQSPIPRRKVLEPPEASGLGKEVVGVFIRPTGEKQVFVREYLRFRFDRWECVTAHYRRYPRR